MYEDIITLVTEAGGKMPALMVVERLSISGADPDKAATLVARLVSDGTVEINSDFELVLPA